MPAGARIAQAAGSSIIVLGVLALAPGCEPAAAEREATQRAPIVGGELDTVNNGVVSVLKKTDGGFYPACSGTLLTANLVLTAHHCVAALSSADGATVECGETEFLRTESPSSFLVSIEANVGRDGLDPYQVSRVWVPEGDRGVCGRDIAFLLLSGKGVATSAATPIAPRLTAEVDRNEQLSAIGYGLQDPGDERGQSAGQRMGVDDAQVFCTGLSCDTDVVDETEWVAASPVCMGDSGGPALDRAGQVVGVTSRGDSECTLGIYTSVYVWGDLIKQKTREAAQIGGFAPPSWAAEPASGGASVGGGGSTGGGAGGLAVGGGGAAGGPASQPTERLGRECSGACGGSYLCWSESGQAPGICVPTCDELRACPADYACNEAVGACVPATDADSSSCSVSVPRRAPSSQGELWGLTLLGAVLLRRAKSMKR